MKKKKHPKYIYDDNEEKGTLYIKVYNGDGKKPTTIRGFKSEREAEDALARLRVEAIDRRNTANKRPIEESYTFNDIANKVLEEMITFKQHISANERCSRMLVIINESGFMNKTIKEYKKEDFEILTKYLDSALSPKLKKPYSALYKNNILQFVKRVFTYAENNYGVRNFIYKSIPSYDESKEEYERRKKAEECVWDETDFLKFIKYVKEDKYKLFFALAYYGGLRKGEVNALKWSAISDNSLNIQFSVKKKFINGKRIIKDPKTISSKRLTIIPNSLASLLKERKKKEMKKSGFSDEWFIFDRVKALSESTLDRVKDRAIYEANKNNEKIKRITIHQMRHSYVSVNNDKGIPIKIISQNIGHSSVSITENIYNHTLRKTREYYDDKLSKEAPYLKKLLTN